MIPLNYFGIFQIQPYESYAKYILVLHVMVSPLHVALLLRCIHELYHVIIWCWVFFVHATIYNIVTSTYQYCTGTLYDYLRFHTVTLSTYCMS